ncbi:hypothetical protein TNCV_2075551 [Trichonephila clavipes]|nr:hypothetical protein TNCV_2075551 [Trichonephila clavipes]
MLKCLAEKMSFKFEILLNPNGQYGSSNINGTWDGVIGLVQSRKADMWDLELYLFLKKSGRIQHRVSRNLLRQKKPSQMPKITASTYPFTFNVWISYALMILTATVLLQRMMFRNATLLGSFLSVLGSISLQAIEHSMDTSSWRTLFWCGADHCCRYAFLV